jgi:hypothetical protein
MAVLLVDAVVDCMAVLLLVDAVVDCMAVLILVDAVVGRMAVLLTLRSFEIGSGSRPPNSNWHRQPTGVWGEPRDYSGESRGIFELHLLVDPTAVASEAGAECVHRVGLDLEAAETEPGSATELACKAVSGPGRLRAAEWEGGGVRCAYCHLRSARVTCEFF